MQNSGQVDTMISKLVTGHYNAVIVQVQAYMDTATSSHGAYWKSNILPRSAFVTASFDPLAYLCQQAHANGIETLSASGDLEVRDLRAGRARKLGVRLVASRGGKLYLKGSVAVVTAMEVVADGQRAGAIITRIRALAKKAPPHKDWLDINDTIRDVLALARSEVHRYGVVVETHLAEPVPLVRADRIQVQQVLLNLLINALEALSGVGDGPREVVVRSEPDAAPGVLVTVGDSGPGLDPQRLDRLFDAFYTTKPHGLGLGLAISRRIIEAHGGRLWATANEGQGATFQFTLPTGGGNQHD